MKIRALLQSIMLAMFAGVAVLALALTKTDREIAAIEELQQDAFEITRGVAELYLLAQDYAQHPDERPVAQWRSRHQSMMNHVAKARTYPHGDSRILAFIENSLLVADRRFGELVESRSRLASEPGNALLTRQIQVLSGELALELQRALSRANAVRNDAQLTQMRVRSDTTRLAFIVLAVMLAIVIVGTRVAMRRLAAPITKLRQGAAVIGSGRLEHRIDIDTRDEIGALAQEFNRMAERLKTITASRDELQRETAERIRAETELRKLNAELEQRVRERTASLEASNKGLESFSYSVAHDLKAPLRGIEGYSRLLLEEYAEHLDQEGRFFAHNIRNATTQMGKLIDDLLAYSRFDRRALALARVDPRNIVNARVAERAEDMRARRVQLRVDVACESVSAEPDGLSIALRNLLDNALKFSQEVPEPHVEVGGREQGDKCLLWVRDNGPGFDMRYHDKIFEAFQRLHRAEDFPGTGIGLAMTRKAVERMNGRVWAESAPGQGATFFLEIPKSDQIVAPL